MIFLFKLETAGFSREDVGAQKDVGAIIRSERPGIASSSAGRKHRVPMKGMPVVSGDYRADARRATRARKTCALSPLRCGILQKMISETIGYDFFI